jgi:serine/threonine protein kinase
VIVQRLTDYIWVGLDSVLNESHITNVARIFYALKASLGKLDSYYEDVQPTSDLPADSRYFPSITTYRHDNKLINFEYVGFLENCPDCTTLHARRTTEPAQDIVVKFVDRYGERAHRLLADLGLAPKLFFCGSPCLSGKDPSYRSLSMVVMEYIDGKTLAQEEINAQMKEKVRLELKRALDLLHDKGLVFGDLRPPNVMITKESEVKLIDFNWAGEKGQAKYPYLISPGVDWPEGVKALAVMEANHDLEMLSKLFGRPAP